MKKSIKKPEIKQLAKAFDGDLDLMLFYLAWVKNGRNATKAYQELHPGIEYASAAVLGSRVLKKVNLEAVLQAYDLTEETYYTQLVEGIKAQKRDQFSGEMSPDHKTRKDYHDKLGKLLGIEQQPAVIEQRNTQFTFFSIKEEERTAFNTAFKKSLDDFYKIGGNLSSEKQVEPQEGEEVTQGLKDL